MKTSLFLFAIGLLSAGSNIKSKTAFENKQNDSSFETNYSNPKDTFYLESIPVYDMDGNLYIVKQAYTSIPTKEDTLEFLKNSRLQRDRMYDSVQRRKKELNSKKPIKKAYQK